MKLYDPRQFGDLFDYEMDADGELQATLSKDFTEEDYKKVFEYRKHAEKRLFEHIFLFIPRSYSSHF